MSRKRARWWAGVLLPGLMLRALIPVGFMPMIGPDHSIHLAVCESFAPLPWSTSSMDMGMPMDMPMDGGDMPVHQPADRTSHPGGRPPLHQDHPACLYGSGPAVGALPTLALLPEMAHRPADSPPASAQVPYFAVSPRAQSPRGPPA
ncbi:MAG: hypothetical protein WBF89_23965 [Steroidobacteraceae bacterium]